jgi:glycosyltransferase involved in cell wall biosynthesis
VTASLDLTLLICTRDRACLLERALERVAAQAVPPATRWEVLVVDNHSTDWTREVVGRFARDPRIPCLRYLRERRQGAGFARRHGLRESRGRLVGFVDDDCLLGPGWAAQALRFADEHPRAGAFGGRNALLWESTPSRVAELYGESLARQDLGDEPRRLPRTGRTCLAGAGLVLRREAVLASGWVESGVLRGRRGDGRGAGEDAEVILRVRHAGWEIWYTPWLRLSHVIPEHRTTLPYLRRLHRGFGQAEAFLRGLSRSPSPTLRGRLAGTAWATGEFARVLLRFYRGFVLYADERPTWLIRLSHAWGCMEGAGYYLLSGRGL